MARCIFKKKLALGTFPNPQGHLRKDFMNTATATQLYHAFFSSATLACELVVGIAKVFWDYSWYSVFLLLGARGLPKK